MKKIITGIFIVLVLLPLFIYFNPFVWGMRQKPRYYPSLKTEEQLSSLNKKYNLAISIGEVVDTVWYFRDIKHKKIDSLQNFELYISDNLNDSTKIKVEKYTQDFILNFEHKAYFDSIFVTTYDSIIYKTSMNEN